MSEHGVERDATEIGVRFLPPHVNAGEVIGPFPLHIAVTFLRDYPAELVERQVSPWVTLCRCEEPSGDGDGPYTCDRHRVPWPETAPTTPPAVDPMTARDERGVEFVVPSVHWLAQALCGWHDAESGREPGESFPCSVCVGQAEYVANHAPEERLAAVYREGWQARMETGPREPLSNPYSTTPPTEDRA